MSHQSAVSRTRARILQSVFQLLYTRLGFLHETAGRVVYGAAWNARRRHVVPDSITGRLLDIGCGEGRLLTLLGDRRSLAIGVEPSPVMARRAARRRVFVVQGTAQSIPLADGTVHHVVATYPGPWIVEPATWDEITRVAAPGASVNILLGGDIRRGRGASARSGLMRIAYGNTEATANSLPQLGNQSVEGEYVFVEDDWGTAIVWSGNRTAVS